MRSQQRRRIQFVLTIAAVTTLLAAIILQAIAGSSEAAATIIDDTSAQITYSGAWVTRSNGSLLGGSERLSEGAGASATYQFRGRLLTVTYTQNTDRGIAQITIDGVRQPDIDQYGHLGYRRTVTYSLTSGTHRLGLVNSGRRNPGAIGGWVGLDALTIDANGGHPAPTPTPIPATATSLPPTATRPPATATAPPPTATRPPATATVIGPTPTRPPATATTVPPTPTRPLATATTIIPTPTATPPGQPVPVAGQQCPTWVHDRLTTAGPDGRLYPTWHPPVDTQYGCWFGHEHGDDPRSSRANPRLPAFGYIGQLVGDNEPHNGFKVFVQNQGAVNNDGRTLAHDSRMVFHMGTGGPNRFVTRFHSLEYDFVARDGSGHEVHVMGMADTGGVGSICASPREGKTVMVLPGLCGTTSPYEIWAVKLNVGGKTSVNASFAAFDPITIMDPANPTRLLAMGDYYPQYGAGLGCKREAYSGPVYYSNSSGPTSFRTNAFGQLDPNGPITQYVSLHNDLGVMMTTDRTQTQAKLGSNSCVSNLRSPN